MRSFLLVVTFLLSTICTTITGQSYDVEIVRDSWGMPHIYGKTDADAAYGAVWAACEDDFETVQWTLLASKGMLGRWLGIEGAKIDFVSKALDLQSYVKNNYKKQLSTSFLKNVDAAIAAANLYAKENPKNILVKKVFPIDRIDFITGYMLAQTILGNFYQPIIEETILGKVKAVDQMQLRGSNTIALSSKKTKDGMTYLDINSHQPLEGPFSWFEIHINSEEGWNCVGATFHGAISILHGANPYLAWAHTSNWFDNTDVFQLEPDPNKKNHYLVDGKSLPLEKNRAKLKIALRKERKKFKMIIPFGKNAYKSIFGPTFKHDHGWFAVRTPSFFQMGAPEQWHNMNKATDFESFLKALNEQQITYQSVCYADREDNIFIASNGVLPQRNPKYDYSKVVPGNTSETLWDTSDWIPFNKIPQVLNPNCGYVYNNNNGAHECTCPEEHIQHDTTDPSMGYISVPTNRHLYLQEWMSEHPGKITWEEFLELKYNSKFPKDEFIFFLKHELDVFDIIFNTPPERYPDIQDAFEILQSFDGEADIEDPHFAFMMKSTYAAYNAIKKNQIDYYKQNPKELEELFVKHIRAEKKRMLRQFGSLEIPLGELLRHRRTKDGTKDLANFGGPDMWNAKMYEKEDRHGKLPVTVGESHIMLVRFPKGQPPILESVMPYGASNNPASPHYEDQMELYISQERKSLTLDKDEIYKNAVRIYRPKMPDNH